MRKTPSSEEIRALLVRGFVSTSHPKRIIMERRSMKKRMLQRGRYKGFLIAEGKLQIRIYDGLFSKRNGPIPF